MTIHEKVLRFELLASSSAELNWLNAAFVRAALEVRAGACDDDEDLTLRLIETPVAQPVFKAVAHPGVTLRGLMRDTTPHDFAAMISNTGYRLSKGYIESILAGSSDITPLAAECIAEVFGPSKEYWLQQQADYNAWRLHHDAESVEARRFDADMDQNKEICANAEPASPNQQCDANQPIWRVVAEALWGILDDISTAGDIAKGDDAMYRAMVEDLQAKKSNYLVSYDGQTLVRTGGEPPPNPPVEMSTPSKPNVLHPGETLKMILRERNLSIDDLISFIRKLYPTCVDFGPDRIALLLQGEADISIDIASMLQGALGPTPSASLWLQWQADYSARAEAVYLQQGTPVQRRPVASLTEQLQGRVAWLERQMDTWAERIRNLEKTLDAWQETSYTDPCKECQDCGCLFLPSGNERDATFKCRRCTSRVDPAAPPKWAIMSERDEAPDKAPEPNAPSPWAQIPDALLETLAEYAHTAWSGWMQYILQQCLGGEVAVIDMRQPSPGIPLSGVAVIPSELVERWSRQMHTTYADLPEEEKKSDRLEARRILVGLRTAKAVP